MGSIHIDFKQGWFWFRHEDQVYYCPEEAQLREWRETRIIQKTPYTSADKFRFCETFSETVIGEKTTDPFSTLIAFEVDGEGVMIFDSTKELQ
jgi:hypothetical protein